MKTWKKIGIQGGGWAVIFILTALYCQHHFAYNYFYQEQFSMFRFSLDYAIETINRIGGLTAYLAAFTAQFFLIPAVGPLVSAAGAVLLGFALRCFWKRTAPALSLPFLYLLPSVCVLWASADFNFHLDGLYSLLLVVLGLNGYIRIRRYGLRLLAGAAMTWIGYALCGPHFLLLPFAAACVELFQETSAKRWAGLLLIPWAFCLPIIAYVNSWAGEWRLLSTPDAYYHTHLPSVWVNYYPASALLLNVLAACLLRNRRKELSGWKGSLSRIVQLACLAWLFHTETGIYNDPRNYQVKALDYYCRTEQWQELLNYPGLRAGQNALHACYQNLALSHLGRLGDEVFRHPQCGKAGILIAWNKQFSSSSLLSDVYYQMGNIALAQTLAFEGMIASERAVNPRLMLRLIQTNLILGYDRVAEKYISLLEETFGYASKARSYRRFLNHPEQVRQDPELGVRQACAACTSGLTNTQRAVLGLQQVATRNPAYQPAYLYYGIICLMHKDLNTFGQWIEQTADRPTASPLPTAFQEALVLLYGDQPERWEAYGISAETISRFNAFREQLYIHRQDPQLASRLQNAYRDTFWYYYMFTK